MYVFMFVCMYIYMYTVQIIIIYPLKKNKQILKGAYSPLGYKIIYIYVYIIHIIYT